MSKLYTEKEIKRRLENPLEEEITINEFIESLTPIQLPTDEEIEGFAKDKINLSNDCFGQYDFTSGKQDGFIDGAIWMRDKIKGGGDE